MTWEPQDRWPPITTKTEERVLAQLRTETSIYGRAGVIRALEEQVEQDLPAAHVLAVSSGTAALHSAYYALGVGPGDEVVCPTLTFFATAMPLFQLGALPVLADCAPGGGIDLECLTQAVGPRTVGVVASHLWGRSDPLAGELHEWCRRHGLWLLEDASHSYGARSGGLRAGRVGDAGVFSLQASKPLPAGEGGLLVTDRRDIYERAVLLGHFNVRAMEEVVDESLTVHARTGLGLKYRMHPLAAALALSMFDDVRTHSNGRMAAARRFDGLSGDGSPITPVRVAPQPGSDDVDAYYSYVFTAQDPDRFVAAARSLGITGVRRLPDEYVLHRLPIMRRPVSPVFDYGDAACVRGAYPRAERLAHSVVRLALPWEDGPEANAYVDDLLACFKDLSTC
jgi:dTDP-4-amino-4,6-dideoxygalactose transaminase